jgi:hypothetical protein
MVLDTSPTLGASLAQRRARQVSSQPAPEQIKKSIAIWTVLEAVASLKPSKESPNQPDQP